MPYGDDELSRIYDRTSGYCHLCRKKLAFSNYGRPGSRGAWEVEHSKPRAMGGSDRKNNLYAACVSCNRDKATVTTRTARRWHGNRRAPLSRERRSEAKRDNALAGAFLGSAIGALGGPIGAAAGALIGGSLGYNADPDGE